LKISTRTLLCLFGILLYSNAAESLSPRDYTFQLSPATKELTQQSVRSVFQDSRGFIWILTQEGLHKFDGYSVTRFRASNRDPASISHQSTTDIVEDSSGFLWISTAGGGLNRYNPANHKFSSIQATTTQSDQRPLSNNIYAMFKDSDGFVWIAYEAGAGFSRFSPDTQTFDHFPPDPTAKQTRAVSFVETSEKSLWILIDGLGLLQLNSRREFEKIIAVPTDIENFTATTRFSHLMASRDGKLWISTLNGGLIKYNPNTGRFTRYSNESTKNKSLSDNTVYMSIEDQSNNIWVATRSGVSVWEPETDTFTWINATNSNIPDDQVFSIFQSKSGIIWIGTFNGLAYGTRSLFSRVDSETGSSGDSINTFAEDDDGRIWIGTNSGIYIYNPEEGSADHYQPATAINERISSQLVMSLLIEGDSLWIGTLDAGLNRLNIKENTVETYKKRISQQGSLKADGITSIVRASNGKLLIGTYGGGLGVFIEESNSFRTYMFDPDDPDSISSNNVIAILEDSAGDVWIGTENGLNLFDDSSGKPKFKVFRSSLDNPESLSSNMPWALHEDKSGTLWIGTQSGGLNSWKRSERARRINQFSQYLESINLPSADVYAITSDSDGNIWMSHNRGLSRFSVESKSTENFDLSDGLQGSEFNHGAVFRDSNSILYFGGNNGFNVIEPNNLKKSVYLPPVQITEFKILNEEVFFDEPLSEKKVIELAHDFRYASFTFASLDYTNPASNQYRYKLKGFDDEWIELGTSRSVSFTSLPAGNYEFLLQGSNSDGVWSPATLSFSLRVHPAPWFSPIAYVLYGIATIFAMAAIVIQQRARSALAIARQRELENKVQERTIDLEEARNAAERANRAKSDFLATVTHEIRTPLHGIIGMTELLQHTPLSDEQKRYTVAAHSSGESLLDLINSILDFSKIEAEKVVVEHTEFDLARLLDEICYIQSEAANRKSLNIFYYIDTEIPERLIGDPTKIRQIITNLFSNAIKFTEEGSVTLRAGWIPEENNTNKGSFYIEVSDTGIGIESKAKDRLFEAFTQADASTTRKYGGTGLGLAISKNFVELMDGELSVESSLGLGTTFMITIPSESVFSPAMISSDKRTSSFTLYSINERVIESFVGHAKRIHRKTHVCRTQTEACVKEPKSSEIIIDVDAFSGKTELIQFLSTCDYERKILLCSFRFDTEPYEGLTDSVIIKPASSTSLLQLDQVNDPIEDPQADEKPSGNKDRTQQVRVLIAEDLETNQKIATAVLEMFGCDVTVANNGEEALERFKESLFDVVFMDCQMPVMDGYEATFNIRKYEQNSGLRRTPIIALTAGNSNEEMRRGITAGMDQYLTKPFKMDEIRDALESQGIIVMREPLGKREFPERSENRATSTTYLGTETLNMRALENIFAVEKQTGADLLEKLIDGYRSQMTQKIEQLRLAVKNQDASSIFSAAHAIKSMSSNLGAERVRVISLEIERLSKADSAQNLAREIVELELANEDFLSAINELPYLQKQ